MHYVRATFILLAIITSPHIAFGQRTTAIAVITVPMSAATLPPAVATNPPPCPGPSYFCKSISRYTNSGLFGITEYLTNYPTCTPVSPGGWGPGFPANPQFSVQPTDNNNNPAGTPDISEPPFTGPNPPGCDGSGAPGGYQYAPIYFKWTMEKNLTSPAFVGKGNDPTATFNATWYSPKGCQPGPCDYIEPWQFQITVPVVRPMGETVTGQGWSSFSGTVGQFGQTLQCCAGSANNGDSNFDFSGEWVTERFSNKVFNCDSPPTQNPANPSSPADAAATEAKTTSMGSSWDVMAGNQWGPDGVGFADGANQNFCSIYWAICKAPTGCVNSISQQMYITSPADQGYDPSVTPKQRDPSVGGTYTNYSLNAYGGLNTLRHGLDPTGAFFGQGPTFVGI
jgi:hypothetical protein